MRELGIEVIKCIKKITITIFKAILAYIKMSI